MRLLITDNRLRVIGSHGDDLHTILTIKAIGREWGIVKEWGAAMDLTPWIDELLARVGSYDPRDVPAWIRERSTP
jgi:hypothetical protein